jgi:hypothetical protein
MKNLESLLAGFGDEEATAIRAAVEADNVVEPVVPEEPVQSSVDVATEVARQVEEVVTGLRDQVAEMIADATAPVVESNDDDQGDLVREIAEGVTAAISERLAAVEEAIEEARAAAPADLEGAKPESRTAVDEDTDENFLTEEDLERMAKDPNLAPGMLSRALRKYEERYGAYVPSDAPRVNIAPEHLSQLQAAHVPGEDFHFDFK